MASFNIKSKQVTDTAVLHLRDPATDSEMYADKAEKEPLTIELYSKGSKPYREALAEVSRKGLQRKGKAQSLKTNMEDNAEFLATVSKAALHFDMDGKPINTFEAFKELYSEPSLFWIRDQVDAFLQDTASFLAK